MKKILFIILSTSLCYALVPKKVEDMSCIELLDAIKTLEKLKESEMNRNYEGAERIALVVLAGTVYFGDRRSEGEYIDVRKEIARLKAKLPDCKPY